MNKNVYNTNKVLVTQERTNYLEKTKHPDQID